MAECSEVLGVCCSSCCQLCGVASCYGTCLVSCEAMGAMLGPANCCACCCRSQAPQWRNMDAPYMRQRSSSFSGSPPVVATVPVTLHPVSIQPPRSPPPDAPLKGSAV